MILTPMFKRPGFNHLGYKYVSTSRSRYSTILMVLQGTYTPWNYNAKLGCRIGSSPANFSVLLLSLACVDQNTHITVVPHGTFRVIKI